jgi:hypothetical protein
MFLKGFGKYYRQSAGNIAAGLGPSPPSGARSKAFNKSAAKSVFCRLTGSAPGPV